MNQAVPTPGRIAFLEERIGYLEEANCTYVAILDMLASSDDFQAELNRGKSADSIFQATIAQLKRLHPFRSMGFLENREDSSFSLVLSEPSSCRDELLADIDNVIMDGTFAWALNRNQSIVVPAGSDTLLLHVIATQARIRGMFIGRLADNRKTIDTPSLNALTITLSTAAHALESCTLYAMLREHLASLEMTIRERTAELETTARELKKSNAKLVKLSDTDPLTLVFNRRYLMAELERRVMQAKQTMQGMTLIIMDIDHFKSINDTYGHQAGDLVLKTVADVVQMKMRSHEIVARYGGEEFVIVLPETSLANAVVVAERLRESVQAISLPPPMDNLTVTVSMGVATMPPIMVDDIDSLIRQADEALYRAKKLGRNRVETTETAS
jgi:diguanylate cyclase (GGDEF)-like protein